MILKYVEERFGISEDVFKGYKFFVKGKDTWIVSEDVPDLRFINRRGLKFARGGGRKPKLTSVALQIFGKYATKNVVKISKDQLMAYLKGENLEVGELEGVERGQVIVVYENDVIGSGLYDGRRIKNQIPKARRVL